MRNLFYFLVGVLLAFCASIAFAADGWKLIAANSVPRATQSAACEDAKSLSGVPTDWTFSHINVTANGAKQCQWTRPNGDIGILGQILPFTCADPNVITNGVCGPKPVVCTAGTTLNVRLAAGRRKDAYTLPKSVDGCEITVVEIGKCWADEDDPNPSNPQTSCDYVVEQTGQVSSVPSTEASTDQPSTKAESKTFNPATGQGCPAGTQNIGTDSSGTSICAGSGTASSPTTKTESQQPSTTTTNSDGSTTKTEVSSRTNSDGSVTTTTTTTNTGADGKVTKTTSTSTTANSSGGGGKSDAESESDFCKKNPNLNVCKNSTVAGDCENTSCEGDAIQCAILRQQRKIACEFSKADDMSRLGGNMMSDNDPLKSTFPTKDNARKVDMPQLNKNGFLGGGACFTDVQFTVQGHQFTLPFSKLCDYLIYLRGVVMLIASLVSWKIVSRSVLG